MVLVCKSDLAMPLTLLLARHGETDLNTEDRWQGRIDAPLNLAGQAQAQQLARDLPAGIDTIVASPMLRARQTAEPAAQRLGLPVAFDDDFRERDFGVFDGLTEAEATAARLVSDAEEQKARTLEALAEEKAGLEGEVEQLRSFETDYRSRLTSYIEGQLREIRAQKRVEPPMPTA